MTELYIFHTEGGKNISLQRPGKLSCQELGCLHHGQNQTILSGCLSRLSFLAVTGSEDIPIAGSAR